MYLSWKLAIISITIKLSEVIGANILEGSFVNVKVNNYKTNCKHISTWINRMYLYKKDTLREKVTDSKQINQYKNIKWIWRQFKRNYN